eukprot:gene35499-18648_t
MARAPPLTHMQRRGCLGGNGARAEWQRNGARAEWQRHGARGEWQRCVAGWEYGGTTSQRERPAPAAAAGPCRPGPVRIV